MFVADVPAGGGYLQQYLPDFCRWEGHEPCDAFTGHGVPAVTSRPLLPLPWSDGEVDVAMSLAGIHHIDDKVPLFKECFRVVKPQGHLVVSDVHANSNVAHFLDDFVGRYNSTGHQGVFLGPQTADTVREVGWQIIRSETVQVPWIFSDRWSMASFCLELFDLQQVTLEEIIDEIEFRLGVSTLSGGCVAMHWSLFTLVAQHP
jgi:ubiquinone/menaquinone biosynthesis C-methylase UbiE